MKRVTNYLPLSATIPLSLLPCHHLPSTVPLSKPAPTVLLSHPALYCPPVTICPPVSPYHKLLYTVPSEPTLHCHNQLSTVPLSLIALHCPSVTFCPTLSPCHCLPFTNPMSLYTPYRCMPSTTPSLSAVYCPLSPPAFNCPPSLSLSALNCPIATVCPSLCHCHSLPSTVLLAITAIHCIPCHSLPSTVPLSLPALHCPYHCLPFTIPRLQPACPPLPSPSLVTTYPPLFPCHCPPATVCSPLSPCHCLPLTASRQMSPCHCLPKPLSRHFP